MKRNLHESIKKIIAYRQSYKCHICSILLPPSFQIDHIIPFSISSNDNEYNLQALCANCHSIKTQKEALRISKFKKMQSTIEHKLCWFCLEYQSDEHNCDKHLKQINYKNNKINPTSFDRFCNNHIYIPNDKDKNKKYNILTIKLFLYNGIISINNMIFKFNKDNDILVEDINNAIEIATKSRKHKNRYSNINICLYFGKIIFDDAELNICIEYIKSNIKCPDKIIKDDLIINLKKV